MGCLMIRMGVRGEFWFRLTQVVPDIGLLNGCVYVHICFFAFHMPFPILHQLCQMLNVVGC